MAITKNIKILRWFNFFTDFSLYSPIAIIYFAQVTGSFALGMSIFSATMISSAIFEVPTGIYSDYIGRKKTVSFGAFFSLLSVVFYALGVSYWILLIGAVLEGLSRSFYSGNNNALLYDTLTEMKKQDNFHDYLGKLSAMFQIALAVSAIIGSIIANWSLSFVFWLSVIPQLICLILSFQLVEPEVHKKESTNIYAHLKESLRQFIKNRKLSYLSLASIISYGIGEASFYFQSAFVQTLWPIWAIGFAKTASYIGGAVSFSLSGRLINRFKAINLLIASNIYNRVINIFSLLFPTVFSPAIMSTSSLFYGVSTISKNLLLQKEFTDHQRATMGSINSLGGSLFFGVYAVLLGLFADQIGPAKALLISNFLSFIVLYLYFHLFHHEKTINS